jgi:hypothetical protein
VQKGDLIILLQQCSDGRRAPGARTPIVYAELRKPAVSFTRNERRRGTPLLGALSSKAGKAAWPS